MMTKQHYLEIQKRYGRFASWAIWADPGAKPKSNIGILDIFNVEKHPEILDQVNPEIVMVGLNFSRTLENRPAFANFHDSRPEGQDYKIRYAFKGTRFYGAYMTDIVKDFAEKTSGKVDAYLRKNRDLELHSIRLFERELHDLNTTNPFIIAFGIKAFNILDKHFRDRNSVVLVPHYARYMSKEDYRTEVHGALSCS